MQTNDQIGGMMSNRQNPINQIYTGFKQLHKN